MPGAPTGPGAPGREKKGQARREDRCSDLEPVVDPLSSLPELPRSAETALPAPLPQHAPARHSDLRGIPRDPLTRESSVSFGSLGASVAHAPSGAYVAHESWLPSGPFRTSRMLRTRGASVGGGLWPSLASVPERSPPFSRDTRVTFFSWEPEHARPALRPRVPDPPFGPGVSGGSWTPLVAFASGKSCRPGWPRGPSVTCRRQSGER